MKHKMEGQLEVERICQSWIDLVEFQWHGVKDDWRHDKWVMMERHIAEMADALLVLKLISAQIRGLEDRIPRQDEEKSNKST